MTTHINLKNSIAELVISGTNGIIEALVFNKKNILIAGDQLFSFALRDNIGGLHIYKGDEFKTFEYEMLENGCFLHFYDGVIDNIEFHLHICKKDKFFLFTPELIGVPESFILEWIDAPQIFIRKEGTLFWPRTEGILVEDFDLREETVPYKPIGFIDGAPGGRYPSNCQMQFIAQYHDNCGVYFAAHDSEHTPKAVEFAPAGFDKRRLSLQTFCSGKACYRSSFAYALTAFNGNWRDACAIYREYIETDSVLPEKKKLPDLVKNSPVVLIYPVQGQGRDCGKMDVNEYFPYIKALPAVLKISQDIDSKILALLMHWEGTAPWAPPFVWPPLGGAEALKSYRDALHEYGHYLGVYCSGTAWTQKSSINSYSREEECEKDNWRADMIRGPKGEIKAYSCNGEQKQRLGFELCLFRERSRRTIVNEIEKMADFGLDYIQFFDQNLGGEFNPCYSREHGHPPVPGKWQSETMKNLLVESASKGVLLGCEAAAADCFISELPMNDSRNNFCWWFGLPVPGYAFVFHEYTNNFMGNQCGVGVLFDLLAFPDNILYRLGYAFNAGDMLSLVLKDNGEIHWGWTVPWDFPAPSQEKIITLVKNLNAFRRKYHEFMQTGRMEFPVLKFNGGRQITFNLYGNRCHKVSSFFQNSWSNGEQKVEILTNYLPENQKLSCDIPAEFAVKYNNKFYENHFELIVPPSTAVLLELFHK